MLTKVHICYINIEGLTNYPGGGGGVGWGEGAPINGDTTGYKDSKGMVLAGAYTFQVSNPTPRGNYVPICQTNVYCYKGISQNNDFYQMVLVTRCKAS